MRFLDSGVNVLESYPAVKISQMHISFTYLPF